MPVLPILLHILSPWRAVSGGLRWVFARRERLLGSVALILAVVALWQRHEAHVWAAQARQTRAAWDAAVRDAALAKTLAEARYRSLADDADQSHARDLARGDAALAAYVAAHRLRQAPADPARAAEDHGAGLPPIPSAEAIVASLSDLRACDADYAYAKAAHDWAMALAARP